MRKLLTVPRVADFSPGPDAPQWDLAPAQPLVPVSGPLDYQTSVQCLYSDRGSISGSCAGMNG